MLDRRELRVAGGDRELLDQVDQAATVAVGIGDQRVARRVVDAASGIAGRGGAPEKLGEVVGGQRLST